MKKTLLRLFAAAASLSLCLSAHAAESSPSDSIYVAGNPDFYPIEYYNSETETFEGVMPEILASISERTGISFVYLTNKPSDRDELAKNLQCEIVSAYDTDSGRSFADDSVTVFSYDTKEGTRSIGFAFTAIADSETVQAIKEYVRSMDESEINGYLVSISAPDSFAGLNLFVLLIVCALLVTVCVLIIIMRTREARRQLAINRMTDPETGIGNLMYFDHNFANTISDYSRKLYYVAYIIIDSNFLQLYHGEESFVDAVKLAAGVLSQHTGDNEFAARITESGFAVAFQSITREGAQQYIDEIIAKLNNSEKTVHGKFVPIYHAAIYNLSASDKSSELLLFNLRRSCSKIVGTDVQTVFCDSETLNSALEEKKLIESFSKAFRNHEFKLYLQFIVDNKTKKITSAEALSRWDNPEKGLVAPGKYIHSMASIGMIAELDYYMFEMVCRQLSAWAGTEFSSLAISCNITRITLSGKQFVEKMSAILEKYTFDRSKLVIEITEDAMEKNRANALKNVHWCKNAGFRIALDDLGSGYTSLSNLCDYPIDIVKIDRDILLKSEKSTGRDLFSGIIALAHSLNLKVVCEGVEDDIQNEFVSGSDCDYIQGWYYSRVFPAKESEAYYKKYTTQCEN